MSTDPSDLEGAPPPGPALLAVPDRPDPDDIVASAWGRWVHDTVAGVFPKITDTPAVTDGNATVYTECWANNAIGTLPVPYRMIVEWTGVCHGNAGGNFVALTVHDHANAPMTPQGNFGDGVAITLAAQNHQGNFHVYAYRDYAAAAVCGARALYKVSSNNVFIQSILTVQLVPIP